MATQPTARASRFLRYCAFFGVVLVSLATSIRSLYAEPDLLAHRPWTAGFGSLCDGGPLVCTRIDELAFNARIDAIVLTSTDLRGIGLVAPYGFSIGVSEHVEGGIYTHSAVWGQPEGTETLTRFQQGPLRLALKGLLWPWRTNPHQRFSVLLDFEYETRLPYFDGQNQLGLLTDLGALRAVANLPLGGVELGVSLGALFDGHGQYGTPEVGVRLGWHLPFLPDVKVFAEGAARGFLARVNTNEPIPGALDSARPILPSGVLGFGIASRQARAVDFAMVAHVGFGDTAPFFLTLRFADIAWGKGYPRPQSLVVDAAREFAAWVQEQIASIDPMFSDQCVMIDDAPPHGTGGSMNLIGQKTPDGQHCLWNGLWLKKNHDNQKTAYWKNKSGTLLCHDKARNHCFARRASTKEPWEPLEPPPHLAVLRGDCIFEDADTKQRLTHFGKLSPDRQNCTDGLSTVPVGTYAGYNPDLHQIDLGQQGPHRRGVLSDYKEPTALQRFATAIGRGVEDGQQENKSAEEDQKAAAAAADAKLDNALKKAEEMTPARLMSGVEAAEQEAADGLKHAAADPKGTFNRALARVRHGIEENAEGAKQRIQSTAQNVKQGVENTAQDAIDWSHKPAMDQAEDVLKLGGRKATTAHRDVTVNVATGAALGATGKVVGGALLSGEKEASAAKRLLQAAEHQAEKSETGSAYGHLADGPKVGAAKKFTRAQKQNIREVNMVKNGGVLRSDDSGVELVKPQKHAKGVTPPSNEAHVDHIISKASGGTNSYSNSQVLSREENLKKGAR